MRRAKLTNAAVEKFVCGLYGKDSKHEGKPKPQDTLWCGELKGFGMRLSSTTGTRTYIFCYRVKGEKKETYITIGRHNDPWRVDDARMRALALKGQMLNGVDPVAEGERKRKAAAAEKALAAAQNTTLRQCMEHYLVHRRTKHGPLRQATKDSIRSHCEDVLSDWIDTPMVLFTRDKCLAKFTELSAKAPGQANLAFCYLRALCNHARELHATDEHYPVLAVNPVTRMFKLRKKNPEKARTSRVPLDRLGAVWLVLLARKVAARSYKERAAVDLVRLELLTGMRIGDASSLKWSQVDFKARTFELLSDVTKNHNGVIFPMSNAVYELLHERRIAPLPANAVLRRRRVTPLNDEYVFASTGKKKKHISDPRAVLKAVSVAAGCNISNHDFRRTLEDIARVCKIDSDERRQLLSHLGKDVHSANYGNNPDPKALAPAFEAIAKYTVDASFVTAAIASGENVLAFTSKAG